MLQLGVSDRILYGICSRIADYRLASFFFGVYPREGACQVGRPPSFVHQQPKWIAYFSALWCKELAKGWSGGYRWPELTKALPFALDTQGPFFVEFRTVVSRAPIGSRCPRIGIVDAEEALLDSDQAAYDVSLGRAAHKCFAIGFTPANGDVAAVTSDGQPLCGLRDMDGPSISCSSMWTAKRTNLNWPVLGQASAPWNLPIHA